MEELLNIILHIRDLAQSGLTYSQDIYDIERFKQIQQLTAKLLHLHSGEPLPQLELLLSQQMGYQTPKIGCRAAIFQDNKILLVKETMDNKWSLPGGWVDDLQSLHSNLIKEVQEEAGLEITPQKLIALFDGRKTQPNLLFNITKVFVECQVIAGEFVPNIETSESRYFSLDELPELSPSRNTFEQIAMCFKAHYDTNWQTYFE